MRFNEFKPLNESGGPLQVPLPGANRSDQVTALQKTLADFHFDVHPTGILDDRTTQAIAKAQQSLGLPVTGKPDSEFIAAVNTSIHGVPGMFDQVTNFLSNMAKSAADIIPNATKAVTNFFSPDSKDDSTPAATQQHTPMAKQTPVKSTSPLATNPKFLAKVDEVAGKLGINPRVLMRIMQHESGLDPHIENGIGCVGLIQFCPPTQRSLGYTKQQIKNMDAISQMDLVYQYYLGVGVKPGMTVGDVYMLTFLPAYKNAPNNTVLGRKNDNTIIEKRRNGKSITKHDIWNSNPAFSNQKQKDYFTKADVIDRINNSTA